MAFNINGVDLKKFNINIGDITHAVKRFDVVKDGITTTVWRDVLDIYPNSDIAWTVDPSTFSGYSSGADREKVHYNYSSAIDVSEYNTLVWKGECSISIMYGNSWVRLYGGTKEGTNDVFDIELERNTSASHFGTGVGDTFEETVNITTVDTLYLTVKIEVHSNDWYSEVQNVFTESIIAKNE